MDSKDYFCLSNIRAFQYIGQNINDLPSWLVDQYAVCEYHAFGNKRLLIRVPEGDELQPCKWDYICQEANTRLFIVPIQTFNSTYSLFTKEAFDMTYASRNTSVLSMIKRDVLTITEKDIEEMVVASKKHDLKLFIKVINVLMELRYVVDDLSHIVPANKHL